MAGFFFCLFLGEAINPGSSSSGSAFFANLIVLLEACEVCQKNEMRVSR